MNRYAIIMFLVAVCIKTGAQRKVVVIDIETHVPVRDVMIRTDRGTGMKTDYRGIAMIEEPFDTITLKQPKYMSRKMGREELKDTVILMPKAHQLSEVTVWGKDRKNIKSMVGQATKDASAYAPPKPLVGFDFANMIDKRRRRDMKHLKKAKEILKEWDSKKTVDK